jgi:predicted acetyltransferase
MTLCREYNPQKDREAVHRIYREIGWLEEGREKAPDALIEAGRGFVADINGEAECIVATAPGTIQYLDEDLPLSCVTTVGTSRIARKQKFAQQVTAHAVAQAACEGASVSALGIFEQGFYNLLGFGTGTYEHWTSFDPASLDITVKVPTPSRLTHNDWEKVHESRLRRMRGHGVCTLSVPGCTKAEMVWEKNSFGLGYFDNGELTHHVWFRTEKVEHGPYSVEWMAYRTYKQFLEIMAVIKRLGDQVHVVTMREPAGIQLQGLLKTPFKMRKVTEKSTYENHMHADAYWQMRILDLKACIEKTHLFTDVSFNLVLDDPITPLLDADAQWQGISGSYRVHLGPHSWIEAGNDAALPTLKASVGAFTRLWLGVRPATGLAVTDALYGPKELLQALDRVLCIPEPHPDWDF